ncbi:MAG: NUDIX hydrolase, partial [Gammaproteobacteria bacterium]
MSKWKMLETTELAKLGPFRIRQDKCQLPDGRIMPKYYVVEFPDWVHVIAITPEGMMVLVDQYRHAAEGRFLELP